MANGKNEYKSDNESVKFDRRSFASFKIFIEKLSGAAINPKHHAAMAILPKGWRNILAFSLWKNREEFEANLDEAAARLGVKILNDWWASADGILISVFVPSSAFTFAQSIKDFHMLDKPAVDKASQKQILKGTRK